MEHPDTDLIIAAVLNGDVDRYEEIIRLFQREVWKVAAVARFPYETAREIVHKTFVDAYSHLDQYQLGTRFDHWIKAIVRKAVRKQLRKDICRTRREQAYREYVEVSLCDETGVFESQRASALRRCMEKLPEKIRKVLVLRYTDRLGLDRIAAIVKQSQAAVKQVLWRTRLALRDCIEAGIGET